MRKAGMGRIIIIRLQRVGLTNITLSPTQTKIRHASLKADF